MIRKYFTNAQKKQVIASIKTARATTPSITGVGIAEYLNKAGVVHPNRETWRAQDVYVFTHSHMVRSKQRTLAKKAKTATAPAVTPPADEKIALADLVLNSRLLTADKVRIITSMFN